jgi:iron complex transport system ATP-binding protein
VLDDVGFAYTPGRPVVHQAALEVDRGELVALVGQSGSGKSTLLKLAAALARPDSGQIRIAGDDANRTSRGELARRLAYLPQEIHLDFPFTVAEIVLMGRYPHRGRLALESANDVRLAEAAMARCDVAGLAGRRLSELSGGERRRALLAQAFCQEAPLVLLDEPTAALDPAHALGVFAALRSLAGAGAGILVVTHDLNLAARACDRVIVCDGGRVTASGHPGTILGGPAARAAFGLPLHVGTLPGGATFVIPA